MITSYSSLQNGADLVFAIRGMQDPRMVQHRMAEVQESVVASVRILML